MRASALFGTDWEGDSVEVLWQDAGRACETLLPLLLTLLFGGADLGAVVSGGRCRGVSGWLNRERTHHDRAEITIVAQVDTPHRGPPSRSQSAWASLKYSCARC